jgi:hypothetical protein
MREWRLGILCGAAVFGLATAASAAQLTVGSGASVDLGTGSLVLGCADLSIAGTFSAGTVGFTQARDVGIGPTGLVNGDSATLEVAGDWENAGTFNAGTSTVQLVDGCGLSSAVITGNSTFYELVMTTLTGKLYSFAAGSTQTVAQSLSLTGASGNLLTIRSTVDGEEAFIDLEGSASTDYVDVKDNHAIGNIIPLGDTSVDSGNTVGWWVFPVPVLPLAGLALLILGLMWAGSRAASNVTVSAR